jgi:inner membrane protein
MITAMDPLCHTLVGATLSQTGLARRTRLATATLILGANAPDVDAVAYFIGDSLLWRRGWTHGVLALAIWPFALTGVMLAWNRLQRSGSSPARARPVSPTALFWLSALAILTHPTLDFLNNYGVRWLAPFSERWFYGDALFIVDPWIWLVLGAGTAASWWLGRRTPPARAWTTPARAALVLVTLYAISMLAFGHATRQLVRDEFARRGVELTRDPMVAPMLATMTRRYVVADAGTRYHVADLRWGWPPCLEPGARIIPKNDDHPAVRTTRAAPEAQGFLRWARFPFFTVADDGASFLVTMDDARYAPPAGHSWAVVQVRVPAGGSQASADGVASRPVTPGGEITWLARARAGAAVLGSWCAAR